VRTLPEGVAGYETFSFSPDNRYVTYRQRFGDNGGEVGVDTTDVLLTIDLADPSSTPVEIVRDRYIVGVAWSPGGDRISFTSGNGTEVVDTDGTNRRVVSGEAFGAWSPDGGQLLFHDFTGVWIRSPEGALVARLSNIDRAAGGVMDARWAPDGRWVLVLSMKSGGGQPTTAQVVPVAGGPSRPLGVVGLAYEWTADGRYIVSAFGSPNGVIWPDLTLISTDGSGRRVISTGGQCTAFVFTQPSLDTREILMHMHPFPANFPGGAAAPTGPCTPGPP